MPRLSWFLLCSRGKTFEQILKVENFENVETRLIVWTNISFDAEKRKQSCLKIGREIKSDNRRNRFLNRSEIFFPENCNETKVSNMKPIEPRASESQKKKLKYFSISLLIMNRRRLTRNYLFAEFIYPLSSLKPNKSEDDEEEKNVCVPIKQMLEKPSSCQSSWRWEKDYPVNDLCTVWIRFE